jgi:hypothetical protein
MTRKKYLYKFNIHDFKKEYLKQGLAESTDMYDTHKYEGLTMCCL